MSLPTGMRATLLCLGLWGFLILLGASAAEAAPSQGEVEVAVILTNFVDQDMGAEHNLSYFENLSFSLTGPSMRQYYLEASYGLLNLSGVVVEPVDLTHNSSYYAFNDSRQLEFITEAVDLADPLIDFSSVEAIMVVHPGPGGETTGNSSQLWSIHWTYTDFIVTDEQTFSEATIVPEYEELGGEHAPLGAMVHEFGHELGLPDLYDTDDSSEGIGKWGLMASGGWLDNGETPGHLSAWSKLQLGWVDLLNVTSELFNVTLEPWAQNNTLYRLPIPRDNESSSEYFLITNRYKSGYDAHLPASGLLIWHIDDRQADNDNESHKLVDLEAADGQADMDLNTGSGGNRGDAGDVWTDSSGDFGPLSNPNSSAYDGSDSGWRIVDMEELGGGRYRFDIRFQLDPVADIQADEHLVDLGQSVNLTAEASHDDDGTLINYTWDLGDGNLSYEVNLTHTYAEAGSYTVWLNVTDNDGLWDVTSLQITVNAPPLATIWVSNLSAKVGQNLSFSALNSSDTDGTILFWQWNFDDGDFVNTAQANHSFDTPGKYNVSLQVLDDHLSSDLSYVLITIINEPPVAAFDLSSQHGNTLTNFQFTANASDVDGTITAYYWDFDDGTNSTQTDPSHTFDTPGNYTVSLTVTDDHGMQATTSQWVDVANSPPVIVLAQQPLVWPANILLELNASGSYDVDGTITVSSWGLSNGGSWWGLIYTLEEGLEPGAYTVFLNLSDDSGKVARTSWTLHIEEVPQLELTPPPAVTVGTELVLNASSSQYTSSWSWDFGDGNQTLLDGSGLVNHTYQLTGAYNVTLWTLSPGGLSNTTTFTVQVVDPPVAHLSIDELVLHQNLEFTLNASRSTGWGQLEIAYRFDNQTWSGYVPTTKMGLLSAQSGNRTLWLKVRDGTGYENLTSAPLYFDMAPSLTWYDTPEIPYLTEKVTLHLDLSDPDDDSIEVLIIWGDGDIQNLSFDLPANTTVDHLYTATGNYQVILGLLDNGTALAAYQRWVVIFDNPDIVVHEPPTSVPLDLSVVKVAAFPQGGDTDLNSGEAAVLGALVTLEVGPSYSAKPQWVEVAFFVDGVLMGTQRVTVTDGQQASVNLNWTATQGDHTLLVLMDPQDEFDDNRTSNDEANLTFSVGATAREETSTEALPGPGMVPVSVLLLGLAWFRACRNQR